MAANEGATLNEIATSMKELSTSVSEMSHALMMLLTRATAAESRQCHAFGEGTDSARFLEQFAIGEDACCTRPTLENAVRRMCVQESSEEFGYQKMFARKDQRRSEWHVESFVRAYLEGANEEFEGGTTTWALARCICRVHERC